MASSEIFGFDVVAKAEVAVVASRASDRGKRK
jgi:hypothetical protein